MTHRTYPNHPHGVHTTGTHVNCACRKRRCFMKTLNKNSSAETNVFGGIKSVTRSSWSIRKRGNWSDTCTKKYSNKCGVNWYRRSFLFFIPSTTINTRGPFSRDSHSDNASKVFAVFLNIFIPWSRAYDGCAIRMTMSNQNYRCSKANGRDRNDRKLTNRNLHCLRVN